MFGFVKRIREFYDVINDQPPIQDKDAYRVWLGDLLDIGEWLARKTPTDRDDQVVDFLRRITANDRAWNVGHGLLLLLMDNEDLLVRVNPVTMADMPDEVKDAANDLIEVLAIEGDDANNVAMPGILTIITLAIEAVKWLRWFRDRRGA
jgi:hypothetical protein